MAPIGSTVSLVKPIIISYSDLLSTQTDTSLHKSLKDAFGSEQGCLGIILIKGLPDGFIALREKLFHLCHRFATLPEDVREELSHPETNYMFGWSHGKEVMNGRPDTQKGSYYANPLLDHPNVSDALRSQHPEYYAGNVWPRDIPGMEEFEPTFKALGKIIFEVGCALAHACETFVQRSSSGQTVATLESLISKSKSNKARLLHYYPQSGVAPDQSDLVNDALCGTHIDHSLLTGLCSAMYLSQPDPDSAPAAVDPTNSSAGLYIYPRSPPGESQPSAVKIQIPPDCLAFQTGETLQLLTSGGLAATPHFVSGNPPSKSGDASSTPVSRETFAFFLQPDVNDVVSPNGETFGQFTKRVLSRHYADKTQSGLPEEAEN